MKHRPVTIQDRGKRKILTGFFCMAAVRFWPESWSNLSMESAHLTFEALVNAYSADLYRYAYWLCKDAQLAEDLVQESFMRAWRALDQLQNPQAAKAWLIKILRRELARHLGKREVNILPLEDVADSHEMQHETGFGEVEAWLLHRALKHLPEHYLEPLILQVVAGYSCDEIASLLDTSTGAIMTRVCRARMQLRSELLHDDEQTKRA